MKLIVAVDNNWGIGYENKLLTSIPADMRFFKEETSGKVVVMGRNTLKSFPGGLPLKNRTNLVITRQENYQIKDAVTVNTIEQALKELEQYNTEDIYVIGGASIYSQMLPYCDTAHVTKINYAYRADTYFPNLDENPEWQLEAVSEEQTYYDLEYYFCKYGKKQKKKS